MKILLLGDFSGFGVNLKEGLDALGHDVTIASGDPGWKKFYFDLNIRPKSNKLFRYWNDRVFPFQLLPKLTGYDVVQFIDPYTFYINFFPRKYFYNTLFKSNKKSFLVAANMDAMYWKYAQNNFSYTPYNDMRKHDWTHYHEFKQSDKAFHFNQYVAENVNGIIPVMYDYEVAYKRCYLSKSKTIPLPINLDKVEFSPLNQTKKITFFHGLNNYGFKGTEYIEHAFNILQKKYPNDLEFILNRRMPFNEYIKNLQKTHVVVDQVNSYSYGMNALYSIGAGKIVMSGAEPAALAALGVESSPIINIRPEKEQIIEEVVKILDSRNKISDLSYASRAYGEKYHDHIKIARCYIDFWHKS